MRNVLGVARFSRILLTSALVVLIGTGCTLSADESPIEGDSVSPGITGTTLRLGISSPLSGPAASAGLCAVAGLSSYLEAKNAAGGFEFGDGNTREVELSYLDDASDPATAVSNFRQLVDEGIFAYVGALGTGTNAGIVPIANELEVPQVLLLTGAAAFSNRQESPWTSALLPSYYDEGFAFGTFLAERGEVTVASLAQNDKYGDDYLAGFEAATDGTDVDVIAAATYDAGDPNLDGRVMELAASGADVLLSIVSLASLQVAVLTDAQSIGWTPEVFLPSNTSTPAEIVIPGGGAAFPAVYSTAFAKLPTSSEVADDEDVVAYNTAFAEYGSGISATFTPHCAWSYAEGAILEQAFLGMTEPTRASFMEALNAIEDFEAPLLLDGVTVNTTDPTRPAIQGLTLVKFDGTGYDPVR